MPLLIWDDRGRKMQDLMKAYPGFYALRYDPEIRSLILTRKMIPPKILRIILLVNPLEMIQGQQVAVRVTGIRFIICGSQTTHSPWIKYSQTAMLLML